MPTKAPVMLISNFSREKVLSRIEYPADVQPKLDGLRCLAYREGGEIKIVGFEKAVGAHEGCVLWVCETPAGLRFTASQIGSPESRRALYNSAPDYIGTYATVKFQTLSNDGTPLHPLVIALRAQEDM